MGRATFTDHEGNEVPDIEVEEIEEEEEGKGKGKDKPSKKPDADDDAFDPRRAGQRRILHVTGFLPEDRPKQLLFRRELRLTFRCDFAHENVARADFRADTDDAVLIEIAELEFGYIGNVVCRHFGAELRVAHHALEILDVNYTNIIFQF